MANNIFDDVSKRIELNTESIQHDLTVFVERVKEHPHSVKTICDEWGSIENYVNVLYWMKFVKKYNPTQMKKIVGKNDLSRNYRDIGWGFDISNFDECNKNFDEYIARLEQIKEGFDIEDSLFNGDEFRERTNDSRGIINCKALPYYGVKTEEELIRRLYYYHYICELSTYDISRIYNFSQRAIEQLLSQLKMNLTASEAQKRAAKKRDYRKISVTRRHTMARTLSYDGVFGSHAENVVRTLLSTKMEVLFSDKFEIIVGLNTRSIISPLEVDIPIIMIHKDSNEIIKIAVEVDGEQYHKSEDDLKRDNEKNRIIIEHGWKIMRIKIPVGMRTDNLIGDKINKAIDDMIGVLKQNFLREKNEEQTETCPKCSGTLIKRTATRGQYAGKEFWGCSNYPKCKYIKNSL